MDYLKEIIKKEGKYINVFIAKESTNNELTGDKTKTYYIPNPVKGILEDLSDASAVYKIPGINTTKSKIFKCHKSYRTIFENSHKIEVDGEIYYGFKEGNGSNMRLKEEGDYIRVYLVRRLYSA